MNPSQTDRPKHTNRLAQETSPYLLQHAHNPVDWYPWGEEAFERARREDKPIFLSVGYSTCYWCHVMERQSFENEAVADVMNAHFVNIKVDREERPDVDQLYMTAVQVLTRHGGWPMSVWLTPDLRPFYGGTYFPPADMHGRPGFVTVLNALDDAYKNRKTDVAQSAEQLQGILQQLAEPEPSATSMTIDEQAIDSLIRRSVADHDPDHGGFGSAPKFPRETLLEMLLVHSRATATGSDPSGIQDRKAKILHALTAMALGGIRDQLGGGFHRYSTDAQWLVPHFEIMLYDNALLGWCYVEAFKQTGEAFYAEVARGVFDFVLREMTSPAGAFYTALDAEVDAQEGMPYIWTADEVSEVLEDAKFTADNIELFCRVYGLDQGPNFADPHHGSGVPEKNVLFVADRAALDANVDLINRMRATLKAAREARKQPLLDTKIITSWNALMIRALAFGGAVMKEPRYIDAAARAAKFALADHRDERGRVKRASRDGTAKYLGFLDDYAYLAQSLIELHDASGDEIWLASAREVANAMTQQFGDSVNGGFYFSSAEATDLIVRQKVASDSPLPSGNAVAAMVLMRLGETDAARRTLELFAPQLRQQAEGMSAMVQATIEYVRAHGPLAVEGVSQRPGVERPKSPEQMAREVVSVRLERLSPTEINLHLSIAPGYHVNTHQPATGMIATHVAAPGLALASIDYPPGQTRTMPFADGPVALYEGNVVIRIVLKTPPEEEGALSLTYQACDDTACLPPITRGIKVTVN